MATTKHALIRYKILDNCFRSPGKKFFINDLIEECEKVLLEMDSESKGISRRQVLDDITFMESSEGWNIELARLRDGKKVYYRYADTSFSINNMPLNEIEINQLQSAAEILSQFRGMPQFEWINELIPKLQQGIAAKEKAPAIIEFDSNPYLEGIDHLGPLHNAIYYKKVLSVSYQPYESELPFEIIINPYFLKQYNNRWFVFGYNPVVERSDWNLALDRILSIKELPDSYIKNTTIDWEQYFDDIIGVTKPIDGVVEDIELHFLGKTSKYMKTKPLHGSQKSKWLDEKTLEVRLKVMLNYELERLILSYADSVVVIKPISLKSAIKDRLHSAINSYL